MTRALDPDPLVPAGVAVGDFVWVEAEVEQVWESGGRRYARLRIREEVIMDAKARRHFNGPFIYDPTVATEDLAPRHAVTLADVLHHPPCPGCGSTAAAMLRAGDAAALCAGCAPPWQSRRRGRAETP